MNNNPTPFSTSNSFSPFSFIPPSSNPNSSIEDFREYIFAADLNDHARLAIQHAGMKPKVVKHMNRALDQYNLAERFQAGVNGNSPARKARVLDFGCGEGLFLHDFAELLESRALIERVELSGIDRNSAAVTTAEEFARLSIPPRPFLNFYEHDGLRPLEECVLLRREGYPYGPVSFDFIFATMVMEHLPNARDHVERLYDALTPGGVIYFYGCELERTYEEFGHFHPTLKFFGQAVSKMIMSVNPGVSVARSQAEWLREAGAEMVQSTEVEVVVGGDTEYGRWLLKDTVMIARGVGKILIERNALTQARFDEMMSELYSQLTAERQGQGWFIETLARKPFL